MLRNNNIRTLALLAMLMISSHARASMSLDRVIVYIKPGELPRQDVVVRNQGNENLYLQTEVYKVINPGQAGTAHSTHRPKRHQIAGYPQQSHYCAEWP